MAQLKMLDKRSKAKKQRQFLDKLEVYANVSRACKVSKVPRRTVYNWIDGDEKFKVSFEKSVTIATGALEDEAVRRAHEGTLKPVFQGGKQVGKIREYSDTLLALLLKARDPQKFRERHEVTGKDGSPLIPGTITHNINFKKCDK